MDQLDPKIVGSIVLASLGAFAYLLSRGSSNRESKAESTKKHEVDKAKRWINAHFNKMKEILAAVDADFANVRNEITSAPTAVGKREIGMWDQVLIRLLERVDLVKTSQGSVDEAIQHTRGEKWETIKQKLAERFPESNDVVREVDPSLDQRLDAVKVVKRGMLEQIQSMHDKLDQMLQSL